MGSTVAGVLLLLLLAVVPAAFAVTFQVGDTEGWASGINYTTWVTGKIFRAGDILEFRYGASHSVSVVNKTAFDGCDSSGATQSFFSGDTKIDLTTVGTIHFICSTPSHCLGGMKLAVLVLPATPSLISQPLAPRSPRKPKTQPPSASPPANGSPSKSPDPLMSSTTSPSPSNAAFKGVMVSYGMMCLAMLLMYGAMN